MYKKLLNIQQKIGKLSRDKENPFFNSKYFDVNQVLEQLLPLLKEEGITLLQPLTNLNGDPAIATILNDGSDQVEYTIPLPVNTDPQKMGSAITYYRRYALQSLFALQADDDDGNKASEKATPRQNAEDIDLDL